MGHLSSRSISATGGFRVGATEGRTEKVGVSCLGADRTLTRSAVAAVLCCALCVCVWGGVQQVRTACTTLNTGQGSRSSTT